MRTPELLYIPNALATEQDTDLVVRAVDGDDSNPGTTAQPLATIPEAINRIPNSVNHVVRVHIGDDGGTPYDFSILSNLKLNANVYFIGDGAGVGDGFNELLASTAALIGSDNNVVKAAGLVVNAYRGKTIEILTGNATGDRRTLRDNTATDLVPVASFSAAIAEDDTYRIVEPAIEISIPAVTGEEWTRPSIDGVGHGYYQYGSASLSKDLNKVWFINLRLVDGYTLSIVQSNVVFCGIELANPLGSLALLSSLLLCGYEAHNSAAYSESVNNPVDDLGVPNVESWLGWGLYALSNTAVSLGALSGFFVINGALALSNKAAINMQGGHITDGVSNLVVYGESDSYFWSHAAAHPIIQVGGNPCIKITNGWLALIYINLYGAGNGVEVREFGRVLGVGITGAVGGIGVVTDLGGQYESDSDLRISGTVGDFSEDGGSTLRAKATLAQNTSFIDAAHGSRIFRAGN